MGTLPATPRGRYRPRQYHDTGATLLKLLDDTASGGRGSRYRNLKTGGDMGKEPGFNGQPMQANDRAPQKPAAGAKPY